MIAPRNQDYLLLRDAAPMVGLRYRTLLRQVKAKRIPESFLMRSGDVRPVVRIHRSWVERDRAPKPALVAEAVLAWGPK